MLSRRGFLAGSLSTIACRHAPAIKLTRPELTHGVQSGDVQRGRAMIWARSSEPARMVVEWDLDAKFGRARRARPEIARRETDLTSVVALDGLPEGRRIHYRVRFEREAERGHSAWSEGSFATPRADRVRVVWTGDTCGQGWGRNPQWGGLLGYKAMLAREPDVFVHSGDMMYADNPILPAVDLPNGRVWRNVTNERVGRVAQDLDDFRARFAYNIEDEHVQALAARVPVIAQWDDHEVKNNWWPGQQLTDPRYRERDASTLAAHARQAFFEWNPVARGPIQRVLRYGPLLDIIVLDARTFRTPNDRNDGGTRDMLGNAQAAWLAETLATSRARWKLVACDMPLALVIPDEDRHEGFANGLTGPPFGRELELSYLLGELRARGVRNTAWITADVHYAAAHYFNPQHSVIDFDPFWEFVAGPIHAGSFVANALDPTFGPELRFQWAPPLGTGNLPPWDGFQSFGTIDVTNDALTVGLWGIDGRERFRVELPYVG